MYTIKVDGQEVYSPALSDDPVQILSPRLQLEVNTAGALSFIIPPGHAVYHTISKLKSIVTMEWDGVEIFRGRVLEEKVDFYNQKEVYCEGALAFLLDSVQRPFTFSGTAKEYCTQAIATHNSQVEAEKQFTMGDFSALTDETKLELESDGYSDTLSAIQAVLEEHEGFLRTRYANGVNYLDYVTSAGTNDGQAIEFGVNLIDLDNHTAAEEICTVMLPIGGMLEDGTTVTIASVNNDSDVIEDPKGILRYGRIVKTFVFDDETDPSKLKSKAQAKMDEMALARTLTLNAVDMHLIDSKQGIILPGVPVLIRAFPQGLDIEEMCTAVDLDPENPEKTVYTFGEPAKTQSGTSALIANQVRTHTNSIQKLYKHYTETDYTVKLHTGLLNSHDEYISQAFIELNGINATIELKADKTEVTELGKRLSSAEIAIDGANARIEQKADQSTVTDLGERLSEAEILIDGVAGDLLLKASVEEVNDLGERLSAAESSIRVNAEGIESKVSKNGIISAINQTAESVRISASKIELDGDTIVGLLEGAHIETYSINASEIDCNLLFMGGDTVGKMEITMGDVASGTFLGTTDDLDLSHSHAVTVNDDGTITLGEVSSTGGSFKIADTAYYKNGVSAAKESVTLSAPNGWQNGRYVVEASNGKTLAVDLPKFTVSGGEIFNTQHKTTVYFFTDGVTGSLASKEVNATPVYNTGRNSVSLEKAWANGILTVTASNGKTKTAKLAKGTVTWDGGVASVPVLDESAPTGYTITVDASDRYNAGWNACRDEATSWKVLVNYYTAGETLYDADGNEATGPWYKGTEAYRYALPPAKT